MFSLHYSPTTFWPIFDQHFPKIMKCSRIFIIMIFSIFFMLCLTIIFLIVLLFVHPNSFHLKVHSVENIVFFYTTKTLHKVDKLPSIAIDSQRNLCQFINIVTYYSHFYWAIYKNDEKKEIEVMRRFKKQKTGKNTTTQLSYLIEIVTTNFLTYIIF